MNYYHYTSKKNWEKIQKSGVIKTTCSNLLPPDLSTMQIVDGCLRDKNDDYKKVVWLTNQIRPDKMKLALNGTKYSKTAVRITISTEKVPDIIKWKHFADSNNMDASWRKRIESIGKPAYWFVCEHEIPIECISSVDILE